MPLPEGFEQQTGPRQLEYLGRFMAARAGIDPELMSAIGWQESGWNRDVANSQKGAIGPMQIMPGLARGLGYDPETLTDPITNVSASIDFLKILKEKYKGDPTLMAAAYNAGEPAVDRHGGVPPYLETRRYVQSVASRMRRSREGTAVDIPDVTSLVTSNMEQQLAGEPFYKRLPKQMLQAPAELGIQAARTLTGSTFPPLSPARLMGDVVQTAGLAASSFPVGRLVSGAIQGGAGLASGLQLAADAHKTSGRSWWEQVEALGAEDVFPIGTQVILGSVMGAHFPGTRPKIRSVHGAIHASRKLPIVPRTVAELNLPPPRSGDTAAAFKRLNREAIVDATRWRNVVLAHRDRGRSIPGEIGAIQKRRLWTEMRPITQQLPAAPRSFLHVLDAKGQQILTPPALPKFVTRDITTGRYFARLGDLLDGNQALGNMVNTAEARNASIAASHNVGNLIALRKGLTDTIEDALMKRNVTQGKLYRSALETSQRVGRDARGLELLEKYIHPSEGMADGIGLYQTLTKQAAVWQKRFGPKLFGRLLHYARSIRTITNDPAKASILRQLFSYGSGVSAGVGALAYGVGVPIGPAIGAAIGMRAVYGLATTPTALRLLDAMARTPIGGKVFLNAVGRLAVAGALAEQEVRDEMEKAESTAKAAEGAEEPTPPAPAPTIMPMAAPRPLGMMPPRRRP